MLSPLLILFSRATSRLLDVLVRGKLRTIFHICYSCSHCFTKSGQCTASITDMTIWSYHRWPQRLTPPTIGHTSRTLILSDLQPLSSVNTKWCPSQPWCSLLSLKFGHRLLLNSATTGRLIRRWHASGRHLAGRANSLVGRASLEQKLPHTASDSAQ